MSKAITIRYRGKLTKRVPLSERVAVLTTYGDFIVAYWVKLGGIEQVVTSGAAGGWFLPMSEYDGSQKVVEVY